MKPGTIIELSDARRGTVVYHGLDGYGIKFGEHNLTQEDIEAILSGDGNCMRAVYQKDLRWNLTRCYVIPTRLQKQKASNAPARITRLSGMEVMMSNELLEAAKRMVACLSLFPNAHGQYEPRGNAIGRLCAAIKTEEKKDLATPIINQEKAVDLCGLLFDIFDDIQLGRSFTLSPNVAKKVHNLARSVINLKDK